MEIILDKVPLLCSAARLEMAAHRAAQHGHWHDAQVGMDAEGNLIVTCPEEDSE